MNDQPPPPANPMDGMFAMGAGMMVRMMPT